MVRIRLLTIVWLFYIVESDALARDKPIVAVFDIENKGANLRKEVLNRLADYLAAKLAETGTFETVPRDQVRERIIALKRESYKECYEQSCQIELGKALAADKSLATTILKIGKMCEVYSTLYDLTKETTENAGSAETTCDEVGIKNALRVIVAKLSGRSEQPVVPTPVETTSQARSANYGELIVNARAGTSRVMLELIDPQGNSSVSSSPYRNSRALVGTWRVVARAEGYTSEARQVEVSANETLAITIELKRFGGLRVVGSPEGALVRVIGPDDYRKEGTLPWYDSSIKNGAYRVDVTKAGFEAVRRDVIVEAGQTIEVEVHLQEAKKIATPTPEEIAAKEEEEKAARQKLGFFGGIFRTQICMKECSGYLWSIGLEGGYRPFGVALRYGYKNDFHQLHTDIRFYWDFRITRIFLIAPVAEFTFLFDINGSTVMEIYYRMGARMTVEVAPKFAFIIEPLMIDLSFYRKVLDEDVSSSKVLYLYTLGAGLQYRF